MSSDPRRQWPALREASRSLLGAALACWIAVAGWSEAAFAQNETVQGTEAETIRALMERVEALEARIKSLEAESRARAGEVAVEPGARPKAELFQTAHELPAPAAVAVPRLQIRGFADVTWAASNERGTTNAFGLGQFNLFVTSRLSDRFSVLAETVVEADESSNQFGIELERLFLLYRMNDRLQVSFGRYHSGIGFYNTAYHHSTWLQTALGRPFLFAFEDEGGILPIHNVGVSATGSLPSGGLGLHYIAELGNGRATRTELGQSPVQNVSDENNGKSFNLALFARPSAIRGLQFGFSAYHDNRTPLGQPPIEEKIFAAHAVYQGERFEFLNEAVLVRHRFGGTILNTPGFYTQISHQLGPWRPYFRYQYINAPDREPLFPDVRRQEGPSLGVRYNINDWTALKVQYDRSFARRKAPFHSLGLQLAFAF